MIDRKKKIYYINKEYSIYADAFHNEVLHLVYKGELNRKPNGKLEELIINTYYPKTYVDIFDDVMFFDKVNPPTKPREPIQNSGENSGETEFDKITYENQMLAYNERLKKYNEKVENFKAYRRNFYDEMAEAGYRIKMTRLNLRGGLTNEDFV